MVWKVSYDFRVPTWTAFGRTLFVQAAAAADARVDAAAAVLAAVPLGAVILRVAVTASSAAEQQRAARRDAAAQQWLANVAQGIPNSRGDL